ncbi:MAG TPA: hypothetical protein PK794_12855, partial [Armatimonadota bacterium]|nr:hypothetical protein [Armatimonadota bacterium]
PSSTRAKATCVIGDPATDIDRRHGDGVIVSCVDGHVAFVDMKNTTDVVATLAAKDINLYAGAQAVIADKRTFLAVGASNDRWHDSAFTLTLPDGCYRKTASDPMAEIIVEWDMSRTPITTPEFRWLGLGVFVSESELGHPGPTARADDLADMASGWYFGMHAYGGPNASGTDSGYNNLYGTGEGKHYFCGGGTANTISAGSTPRLDVVPIKCNTFYHCKAIFAAGKAMVTVSEGSQVLGTVSYSLNLANDQAPGHNRIAPLTKTRNTEAMTFKNIKVYRLGAPPAM